MKLRHNLPVTVLILSCLGSHPVMSASNPRADVGDPMLAEYFRIETGKLAAACLVEPPDKAGWAAWREAHRQQLLEMLGLWPMPERTSLEPVVTGRLAADDFEVEKVHFQSMPGLFVTANLYLPAGVNRPAPAILYVCGHGATIREGVSYGNKVNYHHHAVWFARHGYVCLIIDTLQLGEIQGMHHGTYRFGQWWWNARGYTPAGVEAWNGIRAIDYLVSRPEVDPQRIGMTGRSGGGAYTWFVSALDDRVRVSAPVAGITDLENHVLDGVVEGHCDCMFFVNTHRWDYPMLAALVAPRPLLIANSDKDNIFPLEGVIRLHEKVRRVYRSLNAAENLGLLITEGPHRDTQDLRLPVFRWFNRFLRQDDAPIERAALRLFEPEQLRVFDQLPDNARNTTIQDTFVPSAPAPVLPHAPEDWATKRDDWLAALLKKSFGGWPDNVEEATAQLVHSVGGHGLDLRLYQFTSQPAVTLPLLVARQDNPAAPAKVLFHVLNDSDWARWTPGMRSVFASNDGQTAPRLGQEDAEGFRKWIVHPDTITVWLAPRGTGPVAWTTHEPRQIQIRRRFQLLGQTVDGMRVWDILRSIDAFRSIEGHGSLPVHVRASHGMAVNALMATLFEPGMASLELVGLPGRFADGPDYLNVLRILDLPEALALAAGSVPVRLVEPDRGVWDYAEAVSARLGWDPDRLRVSLSDE